MYWASNAPAGTPIGSGTLITRSSHAAQVRLVLLVAEEALFVPGQVKVQRVAAVSSLRAPRTTHRVTWFYRSLPAGTHVDMLLAPLLSTVDFFPKDRWEYIYIHIHNRNICFALLLPHFSLSFCTLPQGCRNVFKREGARSRDPS